MCTHTLTLVTKQLVSDGSELGIKTATFCHICIIYLPAVSLCLELVGYVRTCSCSWAWEREGGGWKGGGAQFTKLESSWTRCLHIRVCSMNTRRGLTR